MRVLHLIDPGSPGGGGATLRLLAEPLERLHSIDQDVLVIGPGRHVDLARRCGVEPAGQITGPLHLPTAGRRALAAWMKAQEKARGPYDVIHAWTARSAMLATLAVPHHRRIATVSVGPVSGFHTQVLSTLLERRPLPMLATSTAVMEEYRSLGLPRRLMTLLPAGVNPEHVPAEERDDLRARWGVDERTFLVGAISEPVGWVDARLAATIVARLALTGRAARLVVHHSTLRCREARHWVRRIGLDEMVIVDDLVAEPWRVARGFDAALFVGGEMNVMDLRATGSPFSALTGGGRRLRPMPGIMPLLWMMAWGVPVVAEAGAAAREVIRDGESGLLVNQGDINAAADRLRRLLDDRTVAGRIGAAARQHVRKHFHISAYCVRLKEAWNLLTAGRPVRVVHEEDDPIMQRYEEPTRSWVAMESG